MSEDKLNLDNMYENKNEWKRWEKMEDSDLAKIEPDKLTETEKYYFLYQLENRLAGKYQHGWSQYSISLASEEVEKDGIPEGAVLCYQQNQCENIDPNEQYLIINEENIHSLSFLDIVNRTSREYLTPEGRIDWGKWNNFSKYGAVSVESYETELWNFTIGERNDFDVWNSPASEDFNKKLPYAGYTENTIIVFNKDLITYKRPIDNIKETLETFKTCLEEKQKIQTEREDNWEDKYIPRERPSRRGVDPANINKDDDRR